MLKKIVLLSEKIMKTEQEKGKKERKKTSTIAKCFQETMHCVMLWIATCDKAESKKKTKKKNALRQIQHIHHHHSALSDSMPKCYIQLYYLNRTQKK